MAKTDNSNQLSSKKRIALLSLVAAIALIIVVTSKYLSRSERYQSIITQYGWTVVKGHYDYSDNLTSDFMETELNRQKIAASIDIGLDPVKYMWKHADLYEFQLGETIAIGGDTSNLISQLWVADGEVIGAWISHIVPNKRIQYWSLNTKPEQITDDISRVD